MHHISEDIPRWGSLGAGTLPQQGSAPTSWGPQTGEGTQSLLWDITLPDKLRYSECITSDSIYLFLQTLIPRRQLRDRTSFLLTLGVHVFRYLHASALGMLLHVFLLLWFHPSILCILGSILCIFCSIHVVPKMKRVLSPCGASSIGGQMWPADFLGGTLLAVRP